MANSFGAVCFLVLVVLASTASSQSLDSNSESRVVPRPWRPSFEPTNKNAAAPHPAQPGAVTQANVAPPTTIQPSFGANPTANNSAVSSTASDPEKGVAASAGVTSFNGANLPREQGPGITQVTTQLDKLPNSTGQVWREYDISPYTSRITTSDKPQQAILDWVLRETGTEMWFNQPLGILNASKHHLYVYHTPEIQSEVKKIVDRFVRTRGQLQRIDVSLMTVENPNWRAQSYTMLQPIEVRSPGVEAWMISKENAALLQGQLSRRLDAKQHSGGTLTNHDGQTFVLEKTRPVQFIRSLRWVPNQIPNYQPLMTNINEGYSLAVSCLSSLDNNTIEATVKCDVDQVEKLSNVKINLPGTGGNVQQMNLQIPQLVSWRLHERFRWPNDQVLLLSCGVVATLDPDTPGGFRIPGLMTKPKRADALLFLEYRGPATEATVPRTADSRLAPIRPRQ